MATLPADAPAASLSRVGVGHAAHCRISGPVRHGEVLRWDRSPSAPTPAAQSRRRYMSGMRLLWMRGGPGSRPRPGAGLTKIGLRGQRRRASTRPRGKPCRARMSWRCWFTGSHTDIGAGDITLRWMLGECVKPSTTCPSRIAGATAHRAGGRPFPLITDSWTTVWRWIEWVPRLTIDNSGRWPRRRPAIGHDGRRHPGWLRRNGASWAHGTAWSANLMKASEPGPSSESTLSRARAATSETPSRTRIR